MFAEKLGRLTVRYTGKETHETTEIDHDIIFCKVRHRRKLTDEISTTAF